jgi:hypothetical protein
VGSGADLDAVLKRKFPSPCQDSNPPSLSSYPSARKYNLFFFYNWNCACRRIHFASVHSSNNLAFRAEMLMEKWVVLM